MRSRAVQGFAGAGLVNAIDDHVEFSHSWAHFASGYSAQWLGNVPQIDAILMYYVVLRRTAYMGADDIALP